MLGDGRIEVSDAGSKNGTFVEGHRVQGSVEVSSGQRLAFGPRDFRLYDAATLHRLLRKITG